MRLPFKTQRVTCAMAACLAAFGATSLFADEVLRHVQQSLRDQGFYYGAIDGAPGDETTQAIRRYQIRNGLKVTSQLDDATLKSIDRTEASVAKGSASSHGSSTARTSNPPVSNSDRQYAEATPPPLAPDAPAPAPNQAPVYRQAPPQPAPDAGNADENDQPAGPPPSRPDLRVPPGGGLPPGAVAPSPALSAMFERTPYELAPPPVQADVLRRAQAALLRDGFYDGPADGVPGPRTAEALSNLQQVSHIRATGRLDVQTLAILRLLPRSQPFPPRRYYYGPGPVYEGRIVQ